MVNLFNKEATRLRAKVKGTTTRLPLVVTLEHDPKDGSPLIEEDIFDAAEHLAGPSGWGYDSVFLHVHEENPAALGLYEALAYEKLEALDEAPLRYFYKRLSEYAPSVSDVVAAAGR